MSSVFLEPAVFLALAPYLSRRCLQLCGQSCRQSFDLAYASDIWQVIDFSQWQPLEGHVEPGDADLILALKRVPMGRLRRLVLQSGRISNEGLQKILMMQSQLEELLIGQLHLGHDSFFTVDLLPKLRRLELLGSNGTPGTMGNGEVKELGMQIASKNLETLVLHLPTLRDLQAVPALKTLRMLEVFPPAISFSSLGQLLPEPQMFNETLLHIFKNCQKLQHVRLWGFYMLDTPMLEALCNLPDLEELHAYYLQDVDQTALACLKNKCLKLHLALPP